MKKNPSKKTTHPKALLGIGALSLGLTLSSLATATYAWFDIVSSASLDQIEMSFGGAPSLEMGLKDTEGNIHYASSWNDASLQELDPTYVPFEPLKEVSSMFESSWKNSSFDSSTAFPHLYEPFYASQDPTSTPVAKDGFLQYEMFFRSDRNLYLFLDGATKISPLRELNKSRAEEINAQTGSSLKGSDLDQVVDAVRVSFFSETNFYICSPSGSSSVTYGGLLDLDKDGYYDSRDGKEIIYGDYSGTPLYGEPLSEDSLSPSSPNAFEAKHQKGISPWKQNDVGFQKETSYSVEELALSKSASYFDPSTMKPLAHLKANVPTRLVFTLYAEGWDHHLTEKIANGAFSLLLAFTGLESAK